MTDELKQAPLYESPQYNEDEIEDPEGVPLITSLQPATAKQSFKEQLAAQAPFDPQHVWLEGDFDATLLVQALTSHQHLQPWEDELGNAQGSVRLDVDPERPGEGFWVSIPKSAHKKAIDESVKEYAKLKQDWDDEQKEAEGRDA